MTEQKGNRFLRYFPLLLDALRSSDPTPMRPADARDWIQSHVTVAEEDLSRRIANGAQSIFENDVHWGRFFLAKAGLISSPKRGLWGLTPAGRRTHLTADSTWDLYVRIRDANRPGAAGGEIAAPEVDPEAEEIAYWFVGAVWAGTDDQAERFRAEGIWATDGDERLKSRVLKMKPRDRIAIKASFVKRRDLPFDVGGASVSCMRIKATGTITGNMQDGQTVTVDWDPPSSAREWYFYTYRITLVEADLESEFALKLIQFVFEGASQDYDWWLKQPYWAHLIADKSKRLVAPPPPEPETGDGADGIPYEGEVAPNYTVDSIVGEGAFVSAERLSEMLTRWKEKKNLILQGPPGTGKTFLAKRLGYALIGSNDRETARSRLRVVQFHPSLAYEDFVRGWRPKGKEGLELVDGIFMQAMEAARSEPDRDFVLVIEEINRGNPAQIFGELLTLMEVAKRNRDEAIELAYRRTDGERVYVPPNLYVIGTMNVADRSLALVDLALRRRFAFVNLEPSLGPEWRAWCTERGMSIEVVDRIAARVTALNATISGAQSLGPQFRIGHSYVTPDRDEQVGDGRDWFLAKVETEIAPLLEEYWYDAPAAAKDARSALVAGF